MIDNFIQNWLSSSNIAYNVLGLVVYAFLIVILISIFGYLFGWLERKVIAKAQYRHGPTYVGPFGLLQNAADLIKLLAKSDIDLSNADKLLYVTALPIIIAISVFVVLLIPLVPGLQTTNLGLNLLIVLVAIEFFPVLLFIAGFSSGNKFAAISAQRSVLILISYEIPIILVLVAAALLANSYNLQGIVTSQTTRYFAIAMPIGFIVFYIAMLAELERPPFDLREADNELIAGWLTDVNPPYYALALLLDYVRMFLGSVIIAIIFFGGWLGPSVLPPFIWLLIKATIIATSTIFVRATAMRMRVDRVLRFGWNIMIPLSLINLIITYIIFIK